MSNCYNLSFTNEIFYFYNKFGCCKYTFETIYIRYKCIVAMNLICCKPIQATSCIIVNMHLQQIWCVANILQWFFSLKMYICNDFTSLQLYNSNDFNLLQCNIFTTNANRYKCLFPTKWFVTEIHLQQMHFIVDVVH